MSLSGYMDHSKVSLSRYNHSTGRHSEVYAKSLAFVVVRVA